MPRRKPTLKSKPCEECGKDVYLSPPELLEQMEKVWHNECLEK